MLDAPTLVIGSPPPEGRDLDLLVPPSQEPVLESVLERLGFVRQLVPPFPGYPLGFSIWARFRGCDADAVDAVPLGSFELPRAEVDRLFAEARPIPGFARLVRPAPHHVLLILAHNFMDPTDARAALPAGRRRRVERALAEDPLAYDRARALAPAWGRPERLVRLEAAFALDEAAAGDRGASTGRGSYVRGILRRLIGYQRAWRNGHLVALCGPDDQARSTQAEGLARALEALDISAMIVRPVLRRGRAAARAPAPVVQVLAAGAALAQAAAFGRAVLPGLQSGAVVICDGYLLDAAEQLRAQYGRRLRLQMALMRALSPRPRRAYLVGVEGAEVDGARDPDELCAYIALDVWQAVR